MMNTNMTNSTSWNVEKRRDFSSLDPGTQVPGYGGYIEQLKYHVGDTYGNATNKLSKSRVDRHPLTSSLPDTFNEDRTKVGTGLSTSTGRPGHRRSLTLPKSTGDNKLTEKMVPGYTGYIPRRPFKFGNTYKEDCDVCIDDFLNNTQNRNEEVQDLRKTVASTGRLKPVTDGKTIVNTLNDYRDTHPHRSVLLSDRRKPKEAPMPGYRGFIPRQGVTELGLGTRYNVVCDRSLGAFHDAKEQRASSLRQGNKLSFSLPDDIAKASIQLTKDDRETLMQRRLYKPIGMVPKYTGYMPQNRYQFGKTYGDSTRSLPVCFHDQGTYGDYVSTGAPQVVM